MAGQVVAFKEVRDGLKAANRLGGIHWFRDGRNYYAYGTEQAIRDASHFQKTHLTNPSLLMVMPAPTIYQHTHVAFTKAFVDKYCPWKDQEVVIKDVDKTRWNVIWRGRGHQLPRIGRFHPFVSSHHLNPGDVCIFEVQSYGFMVHIFKAARQQQPQNIQLIIHPKEGQDGGGGEEVAQNKEEDVKPNINNQLEELKFQIVFKQDSDGVMNSYMEIDMPLREYQINKFKGPFTSTESVLDVILNMA